MVRLKQKKPGGTDLKVPGIVCSKRRHDNTFVLVQEALSSFNNDNDTTALFLLDAYNILGCRGG